MCVRAGCGVILCLRARGGCARCGCWRLVGVGARVSVRVHARSEVACALVFWLCTHLANVWVPPACAGLGVFNKHRRNREYHKNRNEIPLRPDSSALHRESNCV